jgi:NAD-dependent deacetylase
VHLEQRGVLHTLVTQNTDGLHLAAGHDPERVVEIHGNGRNVTCWDCGETAPMERALDRVRAGEDDPACRSCGGILKSAAILFGQDLVRRDLARAQQAAAECELLLAVGTTLAVYPAAGMVPIAVRSGARVVIVNLEPTDLDDLADAVIREPISEVLPRLVGTR